VNAQVKLSISKQVVNSDTTRDFVFNVFFAKVSADTGRYAPLEEGDYKLTYTGRTKDAPETVHIQTRSDISHTPWSYTDWYGIAGTSEWSVAQVRVAAGQTVTIEDLPMGIVYDIVEVPVTNYTVTATALNGTVGSNGNVYATSYIYEDAAAYFTNTYTPPEGRDLTIAKTVTGNAGDTNQAFPFSIALTDQDGNPLSYLDIKVLLPNKTETTLTTDESGVLTINLKHGQQVTLKDLPQNTRYTITEANASSYDTTFAVSGGSYDTPGDKSVSGILDDETDVVVQGTNNFDVVVPTGIRMEVWPFVYMLAGVFGIFLLLKTGKRRKQKK
jgi:hypothetical protein